MANSNFIEKRLQQEADGRAVTSQERSRRRYSQNITLPPYLIQKSKEDLKDPPPKIKIDLKSSGSHPDDSVNGGATPDLIPDDRKMMMEMLYANPAIQRTSTEENEKPTSSLDPSSDKEDNSACGDDVIGATKTHFQKLSDNLEVNLTMNRPTTETPQAPSTSPPVVAKKDSDIMWERLTSQGTMVNMQMSRVGSIIITFFIIRIYI